MLNPNYLKRCSADNRLSKITLLAMLEDPDEINTFAQAQRYNYEKMTRGEAYANARMSRFAGLKSNRKSLHSLLDSIDDDQWDIISFDPHSKTVCVEVRDKVTTVFSIKLPTLSITKVNIQDR